MDSLDMDPPIGSSEKPLEVGDNETMGLFGLLMNTIVFILLNFLDTRFENWVHSFAVHIEEVIDSRRIKSDQSAERGGGDVVRRALLRADLMLVKMLLVFFPGVKVRRLSLAQAARLTRRQRAGSETVMQGLNLLSFHRQIFGAYGGTGLSLSMRLLWMCTRTVILMISLLLALRIPSHLKFYIQRAMSIAIVLRFVLPVLSASTVIVEEIVHASNASDPLQNGFRIFNGALQFLIWVLAMTAILSTIGYDMSSALTGLGIGGVAAAFAAQRTLNDLFSTVTLLIDRPFVVGDRVIVKDGDEAIVESIGFRATQMRTIYSGERMFVPNTQIVSSRLYNRTEMTQRRVKSSFYLALASPPSKLADIQVALSDIIERTPDAEFVYAHVMEFNPHKGILVEYVYNVPGNVSKRYKDAQHAINLAIANYIHNNGLEFAKTGFERQ